MPLISPVSVSMRCFDLCAIAKSHSSRARSSCRPGFSGVQVLVAQAENRPTVRPRFRPRPYCAFYPQNMVAVSLRCDVALLVVRHPLRARCCSCVLCDMCDGRGVDALHPSGGSWMNCSSALQHDCRLPFQAHEIDHVYEILKMEQARVDSVHEILKLQAEKVPDGPAHPITTVATL